MEMLKVKLVQSAGRYLVAEISEKALGFSPKFVWCPVPSAHHRTAPYPIPKTIKIGTQDTKEAGARLTPGPFAVVVRNGEKRRLICVRADRGRHLWNFIEFITKRNGVEVRIDFEGHTPLKQMKGHVDVFVLPAKQGELSMALLARGMKLLYPASYKRPLKTPKTPSWWHRPIYCGWGDQVGISLELEGSGNESRAMAYCTQGLYERWLQRLEHADVPIGTVTIDAGWSDGGIWRPNRTQWPDMRGFIDRQHKKGRRVLLWIGTWLCEGLPDKWCIHAGKVKLVADPTNPSYRTFMKENVHRLLSGDKKCFDADGFKVDQLQFTPNEQTPCGGEHFERSFHLKGDHPKLTLAGTKWGCELLYQLQKDIYNAAKSAKPDALITSSTVHPYFHDTLDMVRLHDTGSVETDVFSSMKARADLARAVLPDTMVDADNWVHTDYQKWLNYTLQSYRLGVPSTYYAERFVLSKGIRAATLKIPLKDLRRIGKKWLDL